MGSEIEVLALKYRNEIFLFPDKPSLRKRLEKIESEEKDLYFLVLFKGEDFRVEIKPYYRKEVPIMVENIYIYHEKKIVAIITWSRGGFINPVTHLKLSEESILKGDNVFQILKEIYDYCADSRIYGQVEMRALMQSISGIIGKRTNCTMRLEDAIEFPSSE